jgi:hypothetical protein
MRSARGLDRIPNMQFALPSRARTSGDVPRLRALPAAPARIDRRVVVALAGLPLATGAALIAYIALGVPLHLAAMGFGATGFAAWTLIVSGMSASQRRWLRARVAAGARAGIVAIAAYDVTRYGVVGLASLSFQPFHVFARFGQALLGPATAEPAATVAGALFHLVNGIGFAIAFSLVVARPSIRLGIAWALVLETLMLLLYPGWLGVSLTGELLPVSLAGHVAYGSALGVATRRWLR